MACVSVPRRSKRRNPGDESRLNTEPLPRLRRLLESWTSCPAERFSSSGERSCSSLPGAIRDGVQIRPRLMSRPSRLHVMQLPLETPLAQQVVVGALFDDPPATHDQDHVTAADLGQPGPNNKGRPSHPP